MKVIPNLISISRIFFSSIHTYGNKITGIILFLVPILILYYNSVKMLE